PCLEDGLDRVMAAAAGPETIRPRLEPRFPLRLQRAGHDCLQYAVSGHRDGRFILPLLQPCVGFPVLCGMVLVKGWWVRWCLAAPTFPAGLSVACGAYCAGPPG